MAINKKLVHFKTKAGFDSEFEKGNILETSIVFIKDTKQIYTHGQFYDCDPEHLDEKIKELEETFVTAEKINEDFYTKEEVDNKLYIDPTNGHEYVDMGEAGIWATCDVGASKPGEYGLYFAWGETKGYAFEGDKIIGDKQFTKEDYKYYDTDTGEATKYTGQDDLTTLELEDDAARVNMGGYWRMPTKDEYQKLVDLCNATWIDNYQETEISGMLFSLKTDESKQLFFPAGGMCSGENPPTSGTGASPWTSTAASGAGYANMVIFADSAGQNLIMVGGIMDVTTGHSVRGFMPSLELKEKYLPKTEAEEIYTTKEELDKKADVDQLPIFARNLIPNSEKIEFSEETFVVKIPNAFSIFIDCALEEKCFLTFKVKNIRYQSMLGDDDWYVGNSVFCKVSFIKNDTSIATEYCTIFAGNKPISVQFDVNLLGEIDEIALEFYKSAGERVTRISNLMVVAGPNIIGDWLPAPEDFVTINKAKELEQSQTEISDKVIELQRYLNDKVDLSTFYDLEFTVQTLKDSLDQTKAIVIELIDEIENLKASKADNSITTENGTVNVIYGSSTE